MKKLAWAVIILATAFWLGPTQVMIPGHAAAETIKVGLIFETLGNPVFAEMKQAAVDEAAKHPEVQLTVEGGASGMDLAGMVRSAENLMQRKVDVLSFSAIDAKGIIPTIKKAQAAGIPVVMHSDDTDPPMQANHFVGPDQYRVANLEGAWLAKTLVTGKMAILEGVPGNFANQLRLKGMKDALAKAPGVQVVSVLAANWDRAQGLNKAENILTAHPDIKAIAALNDNMALGVLDAIKGRRLLGKVMVTGINGTEEAVQDVYRGDLAATMMNYPGEVGRQIILTAIRVAKKQDNPKQYLVDTGTDLLTTRLLQAVGPFLKPVLK